MEDRITRPIIEHTPAYIVSDGYDSTEGSADINPADLEIAERLLKHLDTIQKFKDRVDSVDYLSNNAEKLSGNLKFEVTGDAEKAAMAELGFTGNEMDFPMFKDVINQMIDGFKSLSVLSSGAN